MHIDQEESMENNKKRRGMKEIRAYAKQRPKVFTVYIILRLLVVAALIRSAMLKEYESMFVCLLVLVLFMLPSFLERKLKIDLPDTLEIIILIFIFAAEILGELGCYFIHYPSWDTMLHTTSGFLCAAIGFSLVNLLNKDNRISLSLSPLYMAIAAFCFSMTIGVLWEFIEFSADRLFLLDMQKDTVITTISSVTLDATNSNTPIVIRSINDVAVNGQSLGLGGYLDIGLYDTMEDLFVNFIGAVVFSLFGYFYVKHQGKGKLVESLVPRVAEDDNQEE
jgi:hypothetical protein